MKVQFADADLDRLETDLAFTMGKTAALTSAYRRVLQVIRAAIDERDLRANQSRRFEKLKGQRQHQHSLRLNDQYRLIVELYGNGHEKLMRIVAIEDYH